MNPKHCVLFIIITMSILIAGCGPSVEQAATMTAAAWTATPTNTPTATETPTMTATKRPTETQTPTEVPLPACFSTFTLWNAPETSAERPPAIPVAAFTDGTWNQSLRDSGILQPMDRTKLIPSLPPGWNSGAFLAMRYDYGFPDTQAARQDRSKQPYRAVCVSWAIFDDGTKAPILTTQIASDQVPEGYILVNMVFAPRDLISSLDWLSLEGWYHRRMTALENYGGYGMIYADLNVPMLQGADRTDYNWIPAGVQRMGGYAVSWDQLTRVMTQHGTRQDENTLYLGAVQKYVIDRANVYQS